MSSEKYSGEEAGAQYPFTKVFSHLKSFPVISDSLSTIQSHPIGQRSISITSTAYEKFLRPFTPYFIKANEYASPYVTKADDFADQGLVKVEEKFPILKEPTENVKSKVTEQLQNPRKIAEGLYGTGLEFANEKKEYVFTVYNTEYAKDGSKGYLPAAKAGITTTFLVAHDSFQWVVDTLAAKKAPAPQQANGVSS
jgi:hypothetical protein